MTRTTYTWTGHRRGKARRNLEWLWATLTPGQLQRGLDWYATARQWVRFQSMHTPYDTRQVAAVVAVTSPGNGWNENMADAVAALSLHSAGLSASQARQARAFTCYPACLEKAWRILDGEDAIDVVRGPKVTAFWRNLCGDESVPTVDRHAITAAGFKPEEVEQVQRRVDWFNGVKRQYVLLAERHGVTPAQAQAAIWVAERENVKGYEAV